MATVTYKPPLQIIDYASLVDNQIYALTGAMAEEGDVNSFVVGVSLVIIMHLGLISEIGHIIRLALYPT